MENRPHQINFVAHLKKAIPATLNMADEVSELLKISADSAYRRLRGETDFSLEEMVLLAHNYNLSLDSVLLNSSKMVSFRMNELSAQISGFADYLSVLHSDLKWIKQWPSARITYAAEDLPVFYHFFFPQLARFKMVYWNKSILGNNELNSAFVEDVNIPDSWRAEVPRIIETFSQMPSVEIWHEDTLKSTLKQIEYYAQVGYFRQKETLEILIEELSSLMKMVRIQADNGRKYQPYTQQLLETPFELYASQVMIGNNCVLLNSSAQNATYISYNTFNFIQTKNETFNKQTIEWTKNLLSKSNRISEVSEVGRAQYFNQLMQQIEDLRQRLLG
jgi:hypothetical protein